MRRSSHSPCLGCRRFAVALGSIAYPRLWNYLDSDSDVEGTKLALQRSGSTPLDLFCSCKSKSKAKILFDLLTPHSMRWKSLFFSYKNKDGVSLDFLAGQSCPLLEELTLPTMGTTYSHHNFDIIAPPPIREIDAMMYPLPVRLDHGTPLMLTVLFFTAGIDGLPFLPIDYYSLLSSTPYLQELGIRGFCNADYLEPEVATPLQIDLPDLERLELEALHYKTVGFLLSSIMTWPNRYLEVAKQLAGRIPSL
ncbi:hypothetical protein FRC02_001390 [Tulasnella sp. 418]|nr:hypothetical protein FRC02_001390 [Tulasnella sp. 418]